MTSTTLLPDWANAFLQERRYAAVASLRAGSRPFAVPLGFLWRDDLVYLSIRDGRTGVARLRRNAEIVVSVNDQQDPPTWVTISGSAEEIADPDAAISLTIMARYKTRVTGLDLGDFADTWLNTGRVVFRLRPTAVSYGRRSWDDSASHTRQEG